MPSRIRRFVTFFFIVVFVVIDLLRVSDAQTTLSRSCITDPLDSSRNVLELTGDSYSSTAFSISSAVNNCHIYIHDLRVAYVKISSSITNNSNITIRNVTSSDASAPAFVWFTNTITDFSFIDVSGVAHSSLQISATSRSELISISKFDGAVTGRADMTSWMNFTNLEMNNIICDRVAAFTSPCTTSMIYFGADVTNVTALSFSNFAMNNISTICSSATVSYLSAVYFQKVSVHTISITKLAVRNVQVQNTAGICQCRILNFGSTISAIPQRNSSEFTVRDVVLQNLSSRSLQRDSDLRFLHVNSALSNYNNIQLKNISAVDLNSTSPLGAAFVYILRFGLSIAAPIDFSPPSSLVVENIRMERVSANGTSSSLALFFVSGAVTDYRIIQLKNVTAISLNSTSPPGDSIINFLVFGGVISSPVTSSSSSSSSSCSLQIENVWLENANSTGTSSQLWYFYVFKSVSGYNEVQITNATAMSLKSVSSSSDSLLYFIVFESSIIAPPTQSSSSSSLTINNLRVVGATSDANQNSRLFLVSAGGIVDNFGLVKITHVSFVSSSSLSQDSTLFFVSFSNGLTVPSSSPSSSLIIDNLRSENSSSRGLASSQIMFVRFGSDVSNFRNLQFTNLTILSVKSTSTSGASFIFLIRCSAFKTSLLFFSSSSLKIETIVLQNASSTGRTTSQVTLFTVAGTINNFQDIRLSNIVMSNITTSSVTSSAAAIGMTFSGGLSNCSILEIQEFQMKNISSATSSPSFLSTISLLSFSSGATYYNISKIILQNSRIEQVSISSKKLSVVRIFDAGSGFQAESIIIIKNNSLLLFSSSPTTSLISPSLAISAAVVALTSPGFIKMEVANNILSIVDQTWQEICTPANCSMVRVNNVQPGSMNNINNQASTISISRSEIIPLRSSFISFANYASSSVNNPLVNFVLEDNMANFPDPNSVSSLLGFDASPSSSLSFPSLVFVDVKCNQWEQTVDRTYQQQLLSVAASPSQVRNFIQWTCRSRSSPESISQSAVATSSSSNSPSVLPSRSSSQSFNRNSVSPPPTETESNDVTLSRSSSQIATGSKSIDSSMTVSSSSSPSAIVPPPPYRSPLRVIYETTTASTSLLSVLAMSSSASLAAVRARSALHHFDAIIYGDCGLDEESLSSQEDEAADLSSSPTRLKLKTGGYLTGLVVGNVCLIVGVGIVWFVGYSLFGSKNKENQQKNDKKRKKNSTESFAEKFAASNAHLTMMFVVMILLEPTLTSAATSLLGGLIVEGRSVSIVTIICVVLAWFVFLIVGLIWPIWKLVYNRSARYDEFKETEVENALNKFLLRRIVEYMKAPSGEWVFVGEKEKHKIAFELAVPFLEAYTPNNPRFIAIDVSIIVCLSIAEIVGYIIGSSASACLVRGIIVCFVFSVHILLILFYRPLFTDRLSNSFVPVVEIISVIMIAGATSLNSGKDDVEKIEGWSRVAVAQSVVQSVIMFFELADQFLQIWDPAFKKMRIFWSTTTTKKGKSNTTVLTNLMSDTGRIGHGSRSRRRPDQEMDLIVVPNPPKRKKLLRKRKTNGRERQLPIV